MKSHPPNTQNFSFVFTSSNGAAASGILTQTDFCRAAYYAVQQGGSITSLSLADEDPDCLPDDIISFAYKQAGITYNPPPPATPAIAATVSHPDATTASATTASTAIPQKGKSVTVGVSDAAGVTDQ